MFLIVLIRFIVINLLVGVAEVDIERAHGLHDGHHGLQSVAVDDDDELQAFFP